MIVEQLNWVCVLHYAVNPSPSPSTSSSQAIHPISVRKLGSVLSTFQFVSCQPASTKHHVIVGHSRKLGLTLRRFGCLPFCVFFGQSHLALVDALHCIAFKMRYA